MKKTLTFFILLFITASSIAVAATGKIKGRVVDIATREPLIGANVVVIGTSFGAATDLNGEYVISNLEAGTYEVKASFISYTSSSVTNVRVSSDLTTELNFELSSQDVSMGEITIVARRELVNKSNTNAIHVTSREDIENLPVRGMNNIFGLSAGVVLQDNTVFIRGGRIDETGFYLEGVNVRNPMTGNNAVRVVQDAVEEVEVQVGGYTAEYGGANAGIIRQQLKSGTSSFKGTLDYATDNITFKSKDNAYDGKQRLGAYWYGYDELTGSLSGPLLSEKVKFFILGNYNYQRDPNPQRYPGIDLGMYRDASTQDSINLVYPGGALLDNQNRAVTFSSTISVDLNPIQIRFAGTYTNQSFQNPMNSNRVAGSISNMLNTSRTEQRDANNGSGSVKITHVLSNKMYYDITLGYFFQSQKFYDPFLKDNFMAYGDSLANAQFGFTNFQSMYVRPSQVSVYGFAFSKPGDPLAGYGKFRRENFTLSGTFSWDPNKIHSIKIGGEYQKYVMRNYSWANGTAVALAGLISARGTKTIEQVMQTRGVNNYGYDVLGNELNDDPFFGPHRPVFAAAFMQDKITFEDIILNLGLRFDYIDTDTYEFVDPTFPDAAFNFSSNYDIIPEGLKRVPSYSYLSPRIGVSFPVTDVTMFHAQYGKFIQQTRLADIYQGYYASARNLVGGNYLPQPIAFSLQPTKTIQYELGLTQQIGDFASFDLTGYYKDIKDQVTYQMVIASKESQTKNYPVYANGDFSTTKGVELSFQMRRINRIAINASLSFQDAQGTGSFPNSNSGMVAGAEGVTFLPNYVSPLVFNNSYRGSINFDYHFGINDGPSLLHEFGASLLMNFSSGHPFTRGVGAADLEGNPRGRVPVESLNASVTPSSFQVDLRVDKTIHLFDKMKLNIYLFVINLFDRKNVENVFLRTGSNTDDGYISNPQLSGQLVNQLGYADMYRAINIDYYQQYQQVANTYLMTNPYFWGPPRQIRLGLRLEY
ncbi:MAG: TonB-dependent receptor [Ignavibacteriales bacterium]|nr:TonB-dependent receptor [Ignavibacteriales bacterium]